MKGKVIYIYRKTDARYKSIEGLFRHLQSIISEKISTFNIILNYSGGGLKTICSNLRQFKKEKNTVYHITGDVHYMALVTGKKSVLTVHDVYSIVKGPFFKRFYLRLFWFWLPALFVKRITVISEFTRLELQKIIPLAKHKITVINNPVGAKFQYHEKSFDNGLPRILLLGTKPNKNLERVFRALSDIHCEIVLIGKLTDSQLMLANGLNLNLTTKFDLSDDEVAEAYRECDILCFASTYEGFGMPIIEAQATGRPVITSNIGAMKEIASDSAYFVNPFDENSIKNGIKSLIEDAELRNEIILKGLNNVERFRAEHIAQRYMDIYESLLYPDKMVN